MTEREIENSLGTATLRYDMDAWWEIVEAANETDTRYAIIMSRMMIVIQALHKRIEDLEAAHPTIQRDE